MQHLDELKTYTVEGFLHPKNGPTTYVRTIFYAHSEESLQHYAKHYNVNLVKIIDESTNHIIERIHNKKDARQVFGVGKDTIYSPAKK